MNQQSGMEADKEIDRFLQKVKKRDMRQKSILLLGMYALVGSILGFLVQCVAIWYPFYNCVPTSAAVFLESIAVGGVHLFLCRTTTRRAARLADNMGMQERVSTSIEGRGSTDELRILQRIDTRDQLRNISLEKTMPYYIPWKRYVSLGVFLLMGFICLFIPSEAKDVAKQKHEFVKKVEKEQEKIAKAKKVLDKEMAKGKISKESRKKLEESIKTAQKDMKQARSVDEVTAAQKRLETKLLRDVPENISKEAADSLRPFVDGKNLQALSKYQKQLADLAGKQKAVAAVSDELKELGEQLSESKMKELMQQLNEKAQSGALTQQDISEVLRNLDNASASYTRSALLQDQTDSNAATQNQNTQAQGNTSNQNASQNADGQQGNCSKKLSGNGAKGTQNDGQSGSGSQAGSGKNAGSGNGGSQGKNGNKVGSGWNTGGKNGLERKGASDSAEQVWVPEDNGKDGNLTGSKNGESGNRTKSNNMPAKRGTKQEIGAVSGQYKQKAYSKLKKQKIPQSKEDMVKKYFSDLE